jgi:hypothetical protein
LWERDDVADGLRKLPSRFPRITGAFEDGEGGFEPDAGRCIGASEQRPQGLDRGGGQVIELVGDQSVEM